VRTNTEYQDSILQGYSIPTTLFKSVYLHRMLLYLLNSKLIFGTIKCGINT